LAGLERRQLRAAPEDVERRAERAGEDALARLDLALRRRHVGQDPRDPSQAGHPAEVVDPRVEDDEDLALRLLPVDDAADEPARGGDEVAARLERDLRGGPPPARQALVEQRGHAAGEAGELRPRSRAPERRAEPA